MLEEDKEVLESTSKSKLRPVSEACQDSIVATEGRRSRLHPPTIKHLVFSGGIIYGFSFYGAFKYLHDHSIIHIDNIETIYATSIGTILATILSLKYEWDILDNYLINRPWKDVFKFSLEILIECYQKRGLYSMKIVEEMLEPLFRAKDLDINTITMYDFYEYTKIEHHFFTIRVQEFELVDISYKTHPDWRLLDAIYASSCIPPFFQPLHIKNEENSKIEWYTDGGFLANYPIEYCLQRCIDLCENDDIHTLDYTVFGFNLYDRNYMNKLSNDKMNLIEYIYVIISILIYKITALTQQYIPSKNGSTVKVHELQFSQDFKSSTDIFAIVKSTEERIHMIEHGVKCAQEFVTNKL
jgi:patatin-like phospholipase/acyl hydrolase